MRPTLPVTLTSVLVVAVVSWLLLAGIDSARVRPDLFSAALFDAGPLFPASCRQCSREFLTAPTGWLELTVFGSACVFAGIRLGHSRATPDLTTTPNTGRTITPCADTGDPDRARMSP